MEKVLLTTTLELIIENDPYEDWYKTLVNYLGKDYPLDKPINLLTILESNGVGHCLWAFSCTQQDSERINMLIGADIAESVLHLFENKYPADTRPREAIQAARDYANGLISEEVLQVKYSAAAYAAVDAGAALAAARAAAYAAAAALAAAYDAAAYAAVDAGAALAAARAAAYAAAAALAAAYDAAAYADADAARAVSHDAYAAASAAAYADAIYVAEAAEAASAAASAASAAFADAEHKKQADIIRKYLRES